MPQRWPQYSRTAERCRERLRRTRRDDSIAVRHDDERGRAEVLRIDRLTADLPKAASRLVVAVPGARTIARHRRRQRYPVIDPIFERDKSACCVAIGVERREAGEFSLGAERIEHKEEALNHLDRESALVIAQERQTIGEQTEEPRRVRALGMKIPWCREHCQAGGLVGAAQRKGESEQPTHAVAGNPDRRAGYPYCGLKRAFEAPGDVAGQVETALFPAGRPPIDHQRPETPSGEIPQKAALRQEVENVKTVNQGRNDKNHRAGGIAGIIEEARRAFAP